LFSFKYNAIPHVEKLMLEILFVDRKSFFVRFEGVSTIFDKGASLSLAREYAQCTSKLRALAAASKLQALLLLHRQ
jgi:hypothetical protein